MTAVAVVPVAAVGSTSRMTAAGRRLVPLLLLAAAGAAHAAEPAKTSGFGKGKGPLLSRAELRDCLAKQERVRTQAETARAAEAALAADKAEIGRQDAALQESLTTLDRTSAEAVDAYNAKVQRRSQLIDDYNTRGQTFNASVEALRADRDAFAKSCDNRRYDEKDEMAVKNGK